MGNWRDQLENHGYQEEKAAETVPSLEGKADSIKSRPLLIKIRIQNTDCGDDIAKNEIAERGEGEQGSQSHLKKAAGDDEEENECWVCGKKFRSDKALYGHMRLHPDRGWKGVRPPRIAKNRSSPLQRFTETKKQHLSEKTQITDSAWKYRVTARRTPKVWLPSPITKIISQDSETDAVHNLMMLANGDAEEPPLKKEQAGEELEAANGDSTSKKARITETDSAPSSGKQSSDEEEIDDRECNEPIKELDYRIRNSDGRRKQKTVRDLLSNDSIDHQKKSVARFICSTCKKSFPTHQALGGHRASHKKDRIEGDQQHGAADPVQELNEVRPRLKQVTEQHQCKTCGKAFPTGQALGGHQRRHWGGPLEDPSSTVTSQEDNARAGRRLFDLDLNKPPPPE